LEKSIIIHLTYLFTSISLPTVSDADVTKRSNVKLKYQRTLSTTWRRY